VAVPTLVRSGRGGASATTTVDIDVSGGQTLFIYGSINSGVITTDRAAAITNVTYDGTQRRVSVWNIAAGTTGTVRFTATAARLWVYAIVDWPALQGVGGYTASNTTSAMNTIAMTPNTSAQVACFWGANNSADWGATPAGHTDVGRMTTQDVYPSWLLTITNEAQPAGTSFTTPAMDRGKNGTARIEGVGAVTLIPAIPKTETVVDSFDTEISTVTWPTGLRFGTVVWDAGRAAISERSGDYSGIATETTYDFNNSYVYCKITPVPIMTDSTEITLGVRDYLNANGMFFIAFNDAGVTPTVCMRLSVASVNSNFFANYDATVNPWVRMRKDASNVYWDVSPDGTTWTNLKTLATALSLSPVMVELSVGQWQVEAQQGTGYFDNINTTGAALPITRDQSDLLGLADSVSTVKTGVHSVTDMLGLTETFDGTKSSAGAYATTDLLGPTDAVSTALSAVRALADTLAPTDSETSLSGLSRADTAPLTDSLSTAKGAVLTASDNANLTDSVSIDLARSLSYSTTDAFGITDSATPVFMPGGPFNPGHLAGLVSWLDAADYSTGSWPNKGSGPVITIEGTPAPTISVNTLNGLPLVRFKTNEGRVRSTWPYPVNDWTLVYLVRWVGPGVGRAWTVQYPPSNLLVGLHTSQPDWMYDNGGSITPGTTWGNWSPAPGPWRMYGADSALSQGSAFFIDGSQVGSRTGASAYGLDIGWGLSGYSAGPEETIDIEVAELVLYDRKLADLDRQKIEDYLEQKWLSGQAHTLDHTDYIWPTDSFTGDKTSATTLSTVQNLPLSDTETADVALVRADNVGLTDSVLVTIDRVYAKQDFTNPRDSVTTAANTVKALADLAGLSDIITVAWGRAHAQSDTLNETDSQTVSLLATRSDVADLSDTFLGTKTSAGEYATTELLGPVDSWTTVITRSLTADSAGLVDTVSISRSVPVAKTDQVTVTDSITLAVSRTFNKQDWTNPTDSITFTLSRAYAKQDLTNPTDTIDVILLSQGVGWPSVFVTSAFVPKPGKNWIGNVWMPKPWKRWTGAEWKTIGTPMWDAATQAYLDATGLPSSFAPALDGLVVGLKAKGLWTKMLAIYPFIGGTAALHKWNLKNPQDTDAAYRLTFTGGAHSLNLGYRANPEAGVFNGKYADTHLIPRGIFDQNSTSLAFYSLLNVPVRSRCEMGCFNWSPSGRFHIIARYQPSEFYYGMAEDQSSNASVPSSTGLFVATRTGASSTAAYRNGVQVGGSSTPSILLPDVSIWVGGINNFQDRSDLPCGFASVGTGLSAQDNADLYTVVQTYQTALGRQTP